ncbi:hypothetical protein A1O3_03251, partial [Capronia epimyces CBS 606.96]
MYRRVKLQYLFAKEKQYWIVQNPLADEASTLPSHGPTPEPQRRDAPGPTAMQAIFARAADALRRNEAQYEQLGEPNHVSEITPWLRKSRFDQHLTGLDSTLVASSHAAPQSPEDNPRLNEIVLSVERVLYKAYELVPDLLEMDALVLNTFQTGTTSQDPFQRLQNATSFTNYVAVFQCLLCYFIRVQEGHFGEDVSKFVATAEQLSALNSALDIAQALGQLRFPDTSDQESNNELDTDKERPIESAPAAQLAAQEPILDEYVFNFMVALVQHRISHAYESAICSFLAARSAIVHRDHHSITFRSEAQVAGLLSKLIYSCQLIILQDATYIKEHRQLADIELPLQALCEKWVVYKTRGPLGVLSNWRLYTMHVGGAFVPEALVVWDPDGETLTYGDLRYSRQDLVDEVLLAIRQMRRVFYEDLCFGLPDLPVIPVRDLQDDWATNQAGYSFLNDARNSAYHEVTKHWLLTRITQDPRLRDLVFHTEQHELDEGGGWPVRSDFAQQYAVADEAFKEALL